MHQRPGETGWRYVAHAFDEFVEAQCAPFYAETVGRPSLTPGENGGVKLDHRAAV